MRRSPALTGLRGAAVLAVMWLHASFQTRVQLPGGFLGVDVFFVLSAFLITALLVAESHGSHAINLKHFYARRALRLFPATVAMLMLVGVIRLVCGRFQSGLLTEAVGTVLYVANWLSIAHPAQSSYLDHTWSLSVEEQFYLIWPVVLMLLLRRGYRPVAIARWTAAAAAAAVLIRWGIVHAHPGTGPNAFKAYYLDTFARSDELLIGVTVGLLPAAAWRRVGWLSLPALVGLVVLVDKLRIREAFLYGPGQTLTALCAVAVVAGCVTGTGPVARLLALKPLVAVGTISYGLYLYHYPIVVALLTVHLSGTVRTTLGMVLPFPIAIASWYLIEKPALSLKDRFEPATAPA